MSCMSFFVFQRVIELIDCEEFQMKIYNEHGHLIVNVLKPKKLVISCTDNTPTGSRFQFYTN